MDRETERQKDTQMFEVNPGIRPANKICSKNILQLIKLWKLYFWMVSESSFWNVFLGNLNIKETFLQMLILNVLWMFRNK